MSDANKPGVTAPSTEGYPLPLRDWMDRCLSFSVPEEKRANCGDCPMVKEVPLTHGIRFTSKARCCTYIPKLSNFQIGALLLDDDPALTVGKERTAARLAGGRGATPLGLFPDRNEKTTYQTLGEQERFGCSDEYICPYNIAGGDYGCGIWKYRPAACTTWFCRHARGAVSKDYWKKLYKLLDSCEQAVRYQCLAAMEVSPEALSLLLPPLPDEYRPDEISEKHYRAIWGPWAGKETEFYKACAEKVAGWRWGDIVRAGGSELTVRMRQFAAAEAVLQKSVLPARPVLGRFHAAGVPERPDLTRIISYLKTDVLEVPTSVMFLFPLFDGRPLSEILPAAAQQGLDEDFIRTLCDFRILVEAASE